jgi:hypothetical protein
MFLKEKARGHLVEVLDLEELFDPVRTDFTGRLNYGEDLPDPQMFRKSEVSFPSGEALPRCWVDVHYRDAELKR